MKSEELRKHINETVLQFAGKPDDDETYKEMFECLGALFREHPRKANFIQKVLKESWKEYNDKKVQ